MLIAQCPNCHARYKVPNEVAGRRARCKKCGQPFQIPEAPPDSGRLSLTALTPSDEGSTVIQSRIQLDKPTRGKAGAAVRLRGQAQKEAAAAPSAWGPFLRGLAGSLWAPVRPINLAPFLIVWILLTVSKPTLSSYVLIWPALALAVWAIVSGFYLSFQFNTALSAADGQHELPALTPTSGFTADVLVPMLKLGLTRLLVLLPAIIFVAAMVLGRGGSARYVTGVGPSPGPVNIYFTATAGASGAAIPVIAIILLAAGLALWPILVLIAGMGSGRTVFRFDSAFRTLLRTLPAYMCAALTVCAAEAIAVIVALALGGTESSPEPSRLSVTRILLLPTLISLADVYMAVIAMRAIGMYYYHFARAVPREEPAPGAGLKAKRE
jgi:predicted Zn finger-like uncharacterized protein